MGEEKAGGIVLRDRQGAEIVPEHYRLGFGDDVWLGYEQTDLPPQHARVAIERLEGEIAGGVTFKEIGKPPKWVGIVKVKVASIGSVSVLEDAFDEETMFPPKAEEYDVTITVQGPDGPIEVRTTLEELRRTARAHGVVPA